MSEPVPALTFVCGGCQREVSQEVKRGPNRIICPNCKDTGPILTFDAPKELFEYSWRSSPMVNVPAHGNATLTLEMEGEE